MDNTTDVPHETVNEYDELGRLTRVSTNEGTIHYAYRQATGERIRTWTTQTEAPTSAVITDTRYKYDSLGRLEEVVSVVRNGTTVGDPLSTVDNTDWWDTDGATPLTIEGDVTRYAYDTVGNLSRTASQDAGGAAPLIADYVYDELNRLVDQINYADDGLTPGVFDEGNGNSSDDKLIGRYSYVLDEHGKRVASTEVNDQGAVIAFDWAYDDLGRLVGEMIEHDPSTNAIYTDEVKWDSYTHYRYDLVGNRIRKMIATYDHAHHTHQNVDAADVLVSSGVIPPSDWFGYYTEVHSYFYDANDHLLREEVSIPHFQDIYPGQPGDLPNGQLPEDYRPWWMAQLEADTLRNVYTTTFYDYDGVDLIRKAEYHNRNRTSASHPTNEQSLPSNYVLRNLSVNEYGVNGRLAKTTQTRVEATNATGGEQVTNAFHEYTYNDNGVRVTQTSGDPATMVGAKTSYVVDANNPTGYSQVLEERDDSGSVTKSYTIGHDVLLQHGAAAGAVYRLLADGHGSTRSLVATDSNQVVQRYLYDAYGNLYRRPFGYQARHTWGGNPLFREAIDDYVDEVGDALTSLLYSGEQTDKTGLQYLRARYYDPGSGRFNRLDPFAGNADDPQSLHKYAYVHGDPVNLWDPSGLFGIAGFVAGFGIANSLRSAKLDTDLLTFDFVVNTIEGYKNGKTADEIFLQTLGYELAGLGLGAAGGYVLKGVSRIASGIQDLAASSHSIRRSTDLADELLAARRLSRLQDEARQAGVNAHYISRHGPSVSVEDLYERARTGRYPDMPSKSGPIVDSTRFFNHRLMEEAYDQAVSRLTSRNGVVTVSFNAGKPVGEGFTATNREFIVTTNVKAVFQDGKLLTMYPLLKPI